MRCLDKSLQQPTICSFPQFKHLQKRGGRTSTNTASAPSWEGRERASMSEQTPVATKSFALWQWPVSAPQVCGHHPTSRGRPWGAAHPRGGGMGRRSPAGCSSSPISGAIKHHQLQAASHPSVGKSQDQGITAFAKPLHGFAGAKTGETEPPPPRP